MFDLMSDLKKCDVHFVRCVKPNEEKNPIIAD
jgi:myosin heavy subunit